MWAVISQIFVEHVWTCPNRFQTVKNLTFPTHVALATEDYSYGYDGLSYDSYDTFGSYRKVREHLTRGEVRFASKMINSKVTFEKISVIRESLEINLCNSVTWLNDIKGLVISCDIWLSLIKWLLWDWEAEHRRRFSAGMPRDAQGRKNPPVDEYSAKHGNYMELTVYSCI